MSLDGLSPEEISKLKKLLKNDEEATPETSPVKKKKGPTPKAPQNSRAKGKRKPNKVLLLVISVVAVIALALGYGLVIEPSIRLNQAKDELNNQVEAAAIIGSNNEMLAFTPEEQDVLAGSNPKQLALGKDGKVSTPPYFEFKSSNATDKSHVVDLYMDFYSQRSRDFIALNQGTLSSYIGDGKIILRVHPVLQTDGFSVYAPEAVAEVFSTSPKLAWDFFVKLMKESNQILSVNSTEDNAPAANTKEIIDFIAGVAVSVGIPTGAGASAGETGGVDADSLKFVTFFSWLYSGTRAEQLAVGYYPPVLYIDDVEVDQDKWPLSDNESVLKLFSTLK